MFDDNLAHQADKMIYNFRPFRRNTDNTRFIIDIKPYKAQ